MRNSAATIASLNFLTGLLLVSGAPGNRIQGSGRSSDGIVRFANFSVATMLSVLGMSGLGSPPPEAEEWRRRITGWAGFNAVGAETEPSA